jgi:hypothetical protein
MSSQLEGLSDPVQPVAPNNKTKAKLCSEIGRIDFLRVVIPARRPVDHGRHQVFPQTAAVSAKTVAGHGSRLFVAF